jgi:GT2 family glycosyltransferase
VKAPDPVGRFEPRPAPSLSVFIPYYRGAPFIGAAVESVLGQTLQPDEIVICDDGSPDNLEEALGSLAERVRVVRQENQGVGGAMDRALRATTGEFVVWLDQDDLFLPRRLEAIAAAAVASTDLDAIATDALIECRGEVVAKLSEVMSFEADQIRQRAAILTGATFFLWPAIRRSRLLAIGGFDRSFKIMADFDCFVRLILDGAHVGYVDAPLYRYRMLAGSLVSDEAGHHREVVRALTKALGETELSPAERATAQSAISRSQRVAADRAARQALEEGRADARRHAVEVMRGKGLPSPRSHIPLPVSGNDDGDAGPCARLRRHRIRQTPRAQF